MFSYIGSERPALKYLNRHVVIPIASKWHDVGLELMDIEDETELDLIKTEDAGNKERTRKMLKLWCDKKTDASWNNLINVLKNPVIGLYPLALQIEGMLLPESMYVLIVPSYI